MKDENIITEKALLLLLGLSNYTNILQTRNENSSYRNRY